MTLGEGRTGPLLTIAIPNFNYARFLGECISSAVCQRGEDIEILISDNASTDNSWEVIASFCDLRIRAWRQEENIGLFPNWNFLLDRAKGTFFKLLQSDDCLSPNFADALREMVEEWEGTRQLDVLVHSVGAIGEAGEALGTIAAFRPDHGEQAIQGRLDVLQIKEIGRYGAPSAHMIRSDVIRAVGGFSPVDAMRADALMFMRVLSSLPSPGIALNPSVLSFQRTHPACDRRRYSALASIRDELASADLLRERAKSIQETLALELWRGKIAAHATLHLLRGVKRRRTDKPWLQVLQKLIGMGLLARGVFLAPIYAALFAIARLTAEVHWKVFDRLRRHLYW